MRAVLRFVSTPHGTRGAGVSYLEPCLLLLRSLQRTRSPIGSRGKIKNSDNGHKMDKVRKKLRGVETKETLARTMLKSSIER